LVPLRDSLDDSSSLCSSSGDDNDIKIEIVDLSSMGEVTFEDQIIEVVTSPSGSAFSGDSSSGGRDENPRPRKRAKLDHLSMEQKAQHRKMMNRISAQSARDRQRNLMLQQEDTINSLSITNDVLQKENKKLKAANEKILAESTAAAAKAAETMEENNRLKKLVTELEKKLAESVRVRESEASGVKDEKVCRCSSTSEPAVLEKYPLLKGPDLQQTLTFIILMWTFSTWTWTRQRSLRLLNTFPNKSCVRIPILLHLNRLLKEEREKSIPPPKERHWDLAQELLKWDQSKARTPD
jgi:hypothetical protein